MDEVAALYAMLPGRPPMLARIGRTVTIDFDVHYFVQVLDENPTVFGWVSGDEAALLREYGIV